MANNEAGQDVGQVEELSLKEQLIGSYLTIPCTFILSYICGLLDVSILWPCLLAALSLTVVWNKFVTLTELHIRQKELQLHQRRAMNRAESVEWLNFIINRWWVFSSDSIARVVKENMDPMLAQTKPSFVESCEMQHFTLGESTPFIKNIQVFENKFDETGAVVRIRPLYSVPFLSNTRSNLQSVGRYQFTVEAEVSLQSNEFSMILVARVKRCVIPVKIAIENLTMAGTMQVLLTCDMTMAFPHISTSSISFTQEPAIRFSLRLMDMIDLMEIPLLNSWIHSEVMNGLMVALVDPGRLDIHIGTALADKQDMRWATGEPDVITNEVGIPCAQMPCGHFVSRESMARHCQEQLELGRYSITCPYPSCNTPWLYHEVRAVANLPLARQQEVERRLAENYMSVGLDLKRCPTCRTWCQRIHHRRLNVQCGCGTGFCWSCEKPWRSIGYRKCGNPNCNG